MRHINKFIIALIAFLSFSPFVHGQWSRLSIIDTGYVSAIEAKDSIIFLGGSKPSDSASSYFYSKDYGKTWNKCFNSSSHRFPPPNDFVITDKYIYTAEGYEGGSIFRTADWGGHWDLMDFPNMGARVLAMSGSDLYAGGGTDVAGLDCVWRTSIDSVKFTHIWGNNSPVAALVAIDSMIIAGTSSKGIYGSVDRGKNWKELNTGLPTRSNPNNPYPSVNDLIFYNNKIFAGVNDSSGVFYSTDKGAHWQQLTVGLNSSMIRKFAVDAKHLFAASYSNIYVFDQQRMTWQDITSNVPSIGCVAVCGDKVYVGSWSGLWYRSLSTITETNRDSEIPQGYRLFQNYPNPFNPSTTISFSIPSRSFVTLKVYNVMGREVSTLAAEEMPTGRHTRTWDASGLPSGVYFYRLQAGSYTETKRLVVLK